MYFVSQPIVTDGLILNMDAGNTLSYTSGSSTWNDLSGNNSNGTLFNNPSYNPENGGSIILNRTSNNYITLPSSTLFGTSRTFTLMMWVYGQPNIGSYDGFLRIAGSLVFFNPSSATSGVAGGNYRLAYPYPTVSYLGFNMPVNQWFLLTLTNLDSQTPSYYGYSVNGNPLTTASYTGRIETGSIEIGVANYYIEGKVGIVTAYNRILSTSEIQQNFNALRGRYGI